MQGFFCVASLQTIVQSRSPEGPNSFCCIGSTRKPASPLKPLNAKRKTHQQQRWRYFLLIKSVYFLACSNEKAHQPKPMRLSIYFSPIRTEASELAAAGETIQNHQLENEL
jgi:hypothetical protein